MANITHKTKITPWLGYLAPRSEANDTIFQAFQVENSLKPKEHNIKLNYWEIFKQFSKQKEFSKWLTKSTWKNQSLTLTQQNTHENYWKIGNCQLNTIKQLP